MGLTYSFEDNSYLVKFITEQATQRAMEAVGLQAEGYAVLELETPKAHANGEIRPNVDTGRLVNSITHAVDGYSAVIGTNVEYAPYVEMGT